MSNESISIVIPTLGRTEELDSLIESIVNSSWKNCEVIVVDQNGPGMIDTVVEKYEGKIDLRHCRVDFRGAARARNYGAVFATGQYLTFPDDDSEFFPDTLERVIDCFRETRADVLFGRCMDRSLRDSVGKFSREAGYLSLEHHEGMFIEATMFVSRETFSQYPYDESFGVGTFHGAEEAYDLVLRMLQGGVNIYYTPEIQLYHPQKVVNHTDPSEIRRVFTYRCGFSHLCLKHRLYGKFLSRLFKVILYIPWTAVFRPRKTRYYLSELLGLLTGITVR